MVPDLKFQIVIILSSDIIDIYLQSCEIAKWLTLLSWLSNFLIPLFKFKSQIIAVESLDPVAIYLELGENATEVTSSVWASNF